MTSTYSRNVIFTGFENRFASLQNLNVNLTQNIQAPNNWEKNFTALTCNSVLPDFTYFQESSLKLVLDILNFNIDYDEGALYGQLDSSVIEQCVIFIYFIFLFPLFLTSFSLSLR